MHLTIPQIFPAIAAAMVAWLMVRMSQARGMARLRAPGRCPSCGRRLTRHGCRCTET